MRRIFPFIMVLIFLATCFPHAPKAEETSGKKTIHTDKHKKAKIGEKGKATKNTKKKKTAKAPAVAPPPPVVTAPAVVNELRFWSNPDTTRIAVTLDRETNYDYHLIPQNKGTGTTSRLYIDLHGAKVGAGIKDLPVGDSLLKTARIAQYNAETVRVVLDLDSLKDYKLFTFSDPFRIIIDVKGDRRTEISATKEGIQAPAVIALPVKAEPQEKAEVKGKQRVRHPIGKIRRIVVDPGHGGHDPGAIGAGGTKEKDIVLQIGLKLAQKLREELGVEVVMTRSTDIFIELQERTAIANQVGADLFVSVHANAALNRVAAGIETYYLNLAKTEKAAQLAAMENGTTLEKVSLLQAVLFDLMANYKLNDSAHLADEVQKALHKKVNGTFPGVKNLGVKQGPFYVLVGATMPSILVETAFLSNEREEARLRDPQYQDTTAEGIALGIKAYVAELR